jgi:predicted  nucleic acid-binding Zn-ribbon protein
MSDIAASIYQEFLAEDLKNKYVAIEFYIEWMAEIITKLREKVANQRFAMTQNMDYNRITKILNIKIGMLEEQIEHLENRGGFENSGV